MKNLTQDQLLLLAPTCGRFIQTHFKMPTKSSLRTGSITTAFVFHILWLKSCASWKAGSRKNADIYLIPITSGKGFLLTIYCIQNQFQSCKKSIIKGTWRNTSSLLFSASKTRRAATLHAERSERPSRILCLPEALSELFGTE